MVKFYVGDALLYPTEATREQLREGHYIPLVGQGLLLAYEEEGDLFLKVLQGKGGTIYGIEEDGHWANEIGGDPIDTGWPALLDRDEAFIVSASKTTIDIGTSGTGKSVSFSESELSEIPKATLEPATASVAVGQTQVFRLVGLPVGQKTFVTAEGAAIKVEGEKIHVTPRQSDEHIQVIVEVTGEGQSYNLLSVLTPTPISQDITPESPVPVEPSEPATEEKEEIEYDTVQSFVSPLQAQTPVLKKVSHRKRGTRESEKLNAFLIGVRYELNQLNTEEAKLRESMSEVSEAEVDTILVEDERIVFINKPKGVRTIRIGIRPLVVKGTSVKFNGVSLNLSDYTIGEHGIMTLSDQYTKRSGRIEVELTYERVNEHPNRISMDELKRRARRLEERVCQLKEGIENG